MKAFKTFYNEHTKMIDYTEFNIINEFDYEHEPDTNLESSVGKHIISKSSLESSLKAQNNKIKNGEIVIKRCKDCSMYFILGKSEIEFFKKNELYEPKRCKKCRLKNKQKTSGEK